MKLSVWAKKQGISYITAWRWFNDGKLPVKAYRSGSGTIIVQDETETSEQAMGNPQSNDIMSMVLKKTVEFSRTNGTVEDFAAWVLSTFSLKLSTGPDLPRYSRQKPKPEEVQKHFQQFLKPKGEKPKPNMFVAPEETLEKIAATDGIPAEETLIASSIPELQNSFSDLLSPVACSANLSHDNSAGGIIIRSVEPTPHLNYTSSIGASFSSNSLTPGFDGGLNLLTNDCNGYNSVFTTTAFKPTQKELQSAVKVLEVPERPRRGRKPSKSFKKSE